MRTSESWKVYLSTSRQGRTVYDVDEIDDVFVIDGAFNYYARSPHPGNLRPPAPQAGEHWPAAADS